MVLSFSSARILRACAAREHVAIDLSTFVRFCLVLRSEAAKFGQAQHYSCTTELVQTEAEKALRTVSAVYSVDDTRLYLFVVNKAHQLDSGVEETDRREGVHTHAFIQTVQVSTASCRYDWARHKIYSKLCDLVSSHALDLLPTVILSPIRQLLVDVTDLERRQLRASASADLSSC